MRFFDRISVAIFSAVLLSAICACSPESANTQGTMGSAEGAVAPPSASGCDASLWDHVYSPKRLRQLAPCSSVTGVISESNSDADGDQHFLLTLDPGQGTVVNKRNSKKKRGDLVLEIVCANPTTMKKPMAACAGYTNRIPIPSVGAHVRATGTYVLDTHNGWTEIHPVSKFEAVK